MADTAQERQLVVASDHVRLVLGQLGDRNVEESAADVRLGLSLITVADLDLAARTLGQAVSPTLDGLLGAIRGRSEERHCGWVPTMGKNRTLTGVQFKPYSSGGSFDRPTAVAAPAEQTPRPVARGRRIGVGLFDTRLAPHAGLGGDLVVADDAHLAPVAPGGRRLWWEGHATFIAGVIRRHAPAAVLDVRTALRPGAHPDGAGPTADEEWTMPVWDFAVRLADYRDAGVSVINLSVGVSTLDGKPPLVLERAVAHLTPSVVIVAAAGNHGSGRITDQQRTDAGLPVRGAPLFPAALDNVLAVGALDGDEAAEFNPTGAGGEGTAPWIDVFAPGVETVSTYLGDGGGEKVLVRDITGREELVDFTGWARWSGTSFAAGEVTGAVATLLADGHGPADAVAAVRDRFPRPRAAGDA
jgi:membrane-anchored mycosin MYCP